MITLTLPYPPSANRYWRSCRGRVFVSAEAKAYKLAVASICVAQGMRPLEGDLCFSAKLYRPQRRGDADNFLKVLLDSLEGSAFVNDSQVAEIHLFRHDDKLAPRVEITISRFNRALRLRRIREIAERVK